VYRIEGAGPEGTAIIAKHCSSASARIESSVYRDILPRLGVPALGFHGCVGDENGEAAKSCWMFIEDAGDEAYSRDLEQHRVLAGQWLGQLHAAASRLDLTACLTQRGPAWYLAELRSVVESIRASLSNPALSEDDLRALHAILRHCDVLESRWHRIVRLCEGVPSTLVHGDLAGKNTRVRASGAGMAIFALDWETAHWGSPAIDLAQSALRPDLEAWRSAMRHAAVTGETVSRLAEAGRIFRLIVSMSWETARLAGVWPVRAMWHMNSYHAVLADCIQSARWEEAWRPA
jgi:aminoglycoside phosphotransferase (APT) family kinase protein